MNNHSFLDKEKLEKIKQNERKKEEKERQLHQIEGDSKSSGGKICMYVLLAITFISVLSYFIYTVIESNAIIEQLTTIISTSVLALFAVFFLIQSLFLDNKKGRKFVAVSSLLLTFYSVFNIAVGMGLIQIPTQEYTPNFAGKTLSEVSKILSGGNEDQVKIFFTGNHVLFEFNETKVVSRLIEGEYFKIDQMLSSDYETKLVIHKKELLSCIDRALLLIKEGEKKPVIITITDGDLALKINSSLGTMNENIDIIKEGKDLIIGFNPKFLIDALRAIDNEEVTIFLMNPKAPCFIKDENESYIYLILPVNFNTAP